MNETIILSVPPMLDAVYLVPSDISPAAAREIAGRDAPGLFAEPLRELVTRFLESPLLTIETRQVSQLPPLSLPMLGHMGAAQDQLEVVARAERLTLIRAIDRPGWPPLHEWAGRAVAAVIAANADRPVVDIFLPKLLSAEEAIAGLPDANGRMQLTRWVFVPQSSGLLGLWMTTRGLGRFGLPELQTMNVPPQLASAWSNVLSGLGSTLLRTWTDQVSSSDPPAFVEISERVDVGEQDVARAYGHDSAGGGTAALKLVFDPATDDHGDSFLTVLPPDDYSASAGEFMASVVGALFGSSAPDVRRVRRSDAMQAAIQTARDLLPQARQRINSDDFDLNARLMIKYEIQSGSGSEYVWLYVTSWPAPETILGAWANDAVSDPTIRVGRPAVVPAGRIVDWGVRLDGQGFVEGAWTQHLLDQPE